TAIKIAEAVLFPIYGEKTIRDEKPYVVKLAGGKWSIDGSMPKSKPDNPVVGGTFHIVISQRDAQVLEMGHDAWGAASTHAMEPRPPDLIMSLSAVQSFTGSPPRSRPPQLILFSLDAKN